MGGIRKKSIISLFAILSAYTQGFHISSPPPAKGIFKAFRSLKYSYICSIIHLILPRVPLLIRQCYAMFLSCLSCVSSVSIRARSLHRRRRCCGPEGQACSSPRGWERPCDGFSKVPDRLSTAAITSTTVLCMCRVAKVFELLPLPPWLRLPPSLPCSEVLRCEVR